MFCSLYTLYAQSRQRDVLVAKGHYKLLTERSLIRLVLQLQKRIYQIAPLHLCDASTVHRIPKDSTEIIRILSEHLPA